MGISLKDCFIRISVAQGQKKAITFLREGMMETEISYEELDQDFNRMANTFLDRGVTKGDRVILYLQKSLVFIIAHIALQKIGAIGVPVNPGFKLSEMEYLLGDAQASLVLTDPQNDTMIQHIDPKLNIIEIDTNKPYQDLDFFRSAPDSIPQLEIKPEDPGLIIYTSGTTGSPKGAILTQGNLVHDDKKYYPYMGDNRKRYRMSCPSSFSCPWALF